MGAAVQHAREQRAPVLVPAPPGHRIALSRAGPQLVRGLEERGDLVRRDHLADEDVAGRAQEVGHHGGIVVGQEAASRIDRPAALADEGRRRIVGREAFVEDAQGRLPAEEITGIAAHDLALAEEHDAEGRLHRIVQALPEPLVELDDGLRRRIARHEGEAVGSRDVGEGAPVGQPHPQRRQAGGAPGGEGGELAREPRGQGLVVEVVEGLSGRHGRLPRSRVRLDRSGHSGMGRILSQQSVSIMNGAVRVRLRRGGAWMVDCGMTAMLSRNGGPLAWRTRLA